MQVQKIPIAVRLLGFEPGEAARMSAMLCEAPRAGPSYACLHEDSLQEPDLYLVDGENPAALLRLTSMRSMPLALQVGGLDHGLARLARPFDTATLQVTLAQLVAERRRALELLCARGEPPLPERRRRQRLADDSLAVDGPALRQPPRPDQVLIVDKEGAFRDHLARLVGERRLAIAWTDSASTAVRLCDETQVGVAMINTSTPGIDPYALCSAIKAQEGAGRTAVVFLVGKAFPYDTARAHSAGVRGLLDKPVTDRSLVAILARLTSMPA
ncbi:MULTISPECIES: response regulator [Massilia]|uniref:Two-component system response regulator n=1 Tax=Massilia haematophila TaxID=457923 RepID=A0ABV7PNZ3_9BURK|nr:response regulator [Massilia sp.]